MKKLTSVEEADRNALLAYGHASQGGSAPHPDSPVAKAALRAIARQELAHPGLDFAKAVFADPVPQASQDAEVAVGTRFAHTATDHAPVPSNDAVRRNLASLAGVGAVDLSGGASTIGSDQLDGEFLAKMKG
jgi:hypothetical protein